MDTTKIKKYDGNSVNKVKKYVQKQRKRLPQKKILTKKNMTHDIIPISKTKKANILIGHITHKQLGGVPTSSSQPVSSTSSQQTNIEAIRYKNKKINFKKLADAKKGKYKSMLKKTQKSLYGQILYLEYMYYKIMGYWRSVYKHIYSEKGTGSSTVYVKLIDIFSKNIPAFSLHMANGIQVSDFSKLSAGTNIKIYYDIIYSLGMMRRNERYNFLVGCNKEAAGFLGKIASKGAEISKAGVAGIFKASKALIQVASFVKTKQGIINLKDLYNEVLNSDKVMPFAQKAVKTHADKKEFICALFRFRRNQLKYNYLLDKFVIRMKRLFSSPEGQKIGLNGLHEFLYGSDMTKATQYSINGITTNTPLTNLAKFKSNSELSSGNTTDKVTAELKAKLVEMSNKFGMGNAYLSYNVFNNNDKILYTIVTEGNKTSKVVKDVFKYNGPDTKIKMRPDAVYLALVYRVYHMLYHLYPNIAKIMTEQDNWLKLYGLPKFEELSYHKKKFDSLRNAKNYESDYYRYSQSLTTVSSDMSQDIIQLLNVIDKSVMSVRQLEQNTEASFYRNIINYLEQMLKQFNDSTPSEKQQMMARVLHNLEIITSTSTPSAAIPTEFNPPDDQTNVTTDGIPVFESILEKLVSSRADSHFIEYINTLRRYYQDKLQTASGMTRHVSPSKDADDKLYKELGISRNPAVIKGGGKPVWDGSDESLDRIAYYEYLQSLDTLTHKQTGGAVLTPVRDGSLSYFKFNKSQLDTYYKYVIDFVNSPHFIESGSKLDKIAYKLSPVITDEGRSKGIGRESDFMEINYFNYLIKFEMGVLNFDDDSGDSQQPLGTNIGRMASGLPLFYETYLVNYFTNISSPAFIEKNNYSRIGYTLADEKTNEFLVNSKQVFTFAETDPKAGILAKQFDEASRATHDGKNRKIPFTLLEMACMTPEELLSLSSLASNAELSKLINIKIENTMNQKLSTGSEYLKPLERYMKDLYGEEYSFGRVFGLLNSVSGDTDKKQIIKQMFGLGHLGIGDDYATKYQNLNTSDAAKGLRAIAQVFKRVLASTALQDKTDSYVKRFFTVIAKTVGTALLAGYMTGGIMTIPAALYMPWIASNIYRYNSFDKAWDALTDILEKENSGVWASIKQALGASWSVDSARNLWKTLNQDEKEYIKSEARGLYNVYRETKYNMFYTGMFKDNAEIQKDNVKISADTIVKNLAYMGIITYELTSNKGGMGIYIPALIPTWVETPTEYASSVATNPLGIKKVISVGERTIMRCAKVLGEFMKVGSSSQLSEQIVKFAAAFIHWQFQKNTEANKVLTNLKSGSTKGETYKDTIKNIFTDAESDEYGMQIFSELQSGTVSVSSVSTESSAKQISTQRGGTINPITIAGKIIYTVADIISLPELFEGVWDSAKSVFDNLGIFFRTTHAEQRKFVETMNLILGIHKYVTSIEILAKEIQRVEDSLTRTENLLSRKTVSGQVETINKSLVKTGYNDFAMLLLNGNFNGLLTSSIAKIGTDGMINLIQYYRNMLMDILNNEGSLDITQSSKEEVRVKFNKVLTKILVFLRLNALFTDYILMNGTTAKQHTPHITPYSGAEVLAYLAFELGNSQVSTPALSRSSSVSSTTSISSTISATPSSSAPLTQPVSAPPTQPVSAPLTQPVSAPPTQPVSAPPTQPVSATIPRASATPTQPDTATNPSPHISANQIFLYPLKVKSDYPNVFEKIKYIQSNAKQIMTSSPIVLGSIIQKLGNSTMYRFKQGYLNRNNNKKKLITINESTLADGYYFVIPDNLCDSIVAQRIFTNCPQQAPILGTRSAGRSLSELNVPFYSNASNMDIYKELQFDNAGIGSPFAVNTSELKDIKLKSVATTPKPPVSATLTPAVSATATTYTIMDLERLKNDILHLTVNIYKTEKTENDTVIKSNSIDSMSVDINKIKMIYIKNQIELLNQITDPAKQNNLIKFLYRVYERFNYVANQHQISTDISKFFKDAKEKDLLQEVINDTGLGKQLKELVFISKINDDAGIRASSTNCVIIDNSLCSFYSYLNFIDKNSNKKILYIVLNMIRNLFYVLCKNINKSITYASYYTNSPLKLSDLKDMYTYYYKENTTTTQYYLRGLDTLIAKDLQIESIAGNPKIINGIKLFTGYVGGARKTKKHAQKKVKNKKKQSRKIKPSTKH